MPKISEPMTVEEHQRVGAYLFEVRNTLQQLYVDLSNRTQKNAKTVRKLQQVEERLEDLRSLLDGDLARDYPNEFSPRVYYPGTDVRQYLIHE